MTVNTKIDSLVSVENEQVPAARIKQLQSVNTAGNQRVVNVEMETGN